MSSGPRLRFEKLEDRQLLASITGYPGNTAAPTISPIDDQWIAEDTSASLLMSIKDVDTSLESIELKAYSNNPSVLPVDNIQWSRVGEDFRLDLKPAENQSGEVGVTIIAKDGQQLSFESFNLSVRAVNDAPTSLPFAKLPIVDLGNRIEIDLFAAFDDVETPDSKLTYSIDSISNQSLVQDVRIEHKLGKLIIDRLPISTKSVAQNGVLELYVRATDSSGHSVLLGGVNDPTPVYDMLGGKVGIHKPDLPLQPINLLTSYAFFNRVNGRYQHDQFNSNRLQAVLENLDNDAPVVLDIENSFYSNDPAGRERWAEVLTTAEAARPDLNIGVYSYLPERSWYAPVNRQRATDDAKAGLVAPSSDKVFRSERAYLGWLMGNNEFRAEPTFAGRGASIGELVESANPSLYTFYRDTSSSAVWTPTTPDAESNSFRTDELSFEGVKAVSFRRSTGSKLPTGIESNRRYYVVNATPTRFQIAEFPDGAPLSWHDSGSGAVFVAQHGPGRPLEHDQVVLDWPTYARENIAEARKLGLPVNVWLSPSYWGLGADYLDHAFFKQQLDIVAPLVDSITLFNESDLPGAFLDARGWWTALGDFMAEQEFDFKPLEIVVNQGISLGVVFDSSAKLFSAGHRRMTSSLLDVDPTTWAAPPKTAYGVQPAPLTSVTTHDSNGQADDAGTTKDSDLGETASLDSFYQYVGISYRASQLPSALSSFIL